MTETEQEVQARRECVTTVIEWEDAMPGGQRQCCDTDRGNPHVVGCGWLEHTRAMITRRDSARSRA